MTLSGHQTRAILGRYNIVSEADLAQAAWKLHFYLERQVKVSPFTVLPQATNSNP